MKRMLHRWTLVIGVCLAVWIVAASLALADDGGYRLLGWSVDGGGVSASSQYHVSGTAGQPATSQLAGGQFRVEGGFWSPPRQLTVAYLPMLRVSEAPQR